MLTEHRAVSDLLFLLYQALSCQLFTTCKIDNNLSIRSHAHALKLHPHASTSHAHAFKSQGLVSKSHARASKSHARFQTIWKKSVTVNNHEELRTKDAHKIYTTEPADYVHNVKESGENSSEDYIQATCTASPCRKRLKSLKS